MTCAVPSAPSAGSCKMNWVWLWVCYVGGYAGEGSFVKGVAASVSERSDPPLADARSYGYSSSQTVQELT